MTTDVEYEGAVSINAVCDGDLFWGRLGSGWL